jgi:hypothetical protein
MFDPFKQKCCDDCATVYDMHTEACPCCSKVEGIDRIKQKMRQLEAKAHDFDLMIEVLLSIEPNIHKSNATVETLLDWVNRAKKAEEEGQVLAEEVFAWRIASELYAKENSALKKNGVVSHYVKQTDKHGVLKKMRKLIDKNEIVAQVKTDTCN